jgi:hypothetical protein
MNKFQKSERMRINDNMLNKYQTALLRKHDTAEQPTRYQVARAGQGFI